MKKNLTDLESKQLEIINYYGSDMQLKRLTEECGELIVAIAKFQRAGQRLSIRHKIPSEELNNLISEIADVENLIEQIKLENGINHEGVNRVKGYKADRELRRIRTNKSICKTCKYYYEEHCCNDESEYCIVSVSEYHFCSMWEEA